MDKRKGRSWALCWCKLVCEAHVGAGGVDMHWGNQTAVACLGPPPVHCYLPSWGFLQGRFHEVIQDGEGIGE